MSTDDPTPPPDESDTDEVQPDPDTADSAPDDADVDEAAGDEPDPDEPDEPTNDPAEDEETSLLRSRAMREAVRAVVCLLVAAVLVAPLALAWALDHTVVHADIGTSPTRFTLTTEGQSEVRFGVAGTVYVPESRGPLGIVATIERPGETSNDAADLATYVSPQMLELYAGLFHDPERAIEEYVGLVEKEFKGQLIRAQVLGTLGGGALIFLLSHLLPVTASRRRIRVGVAVVVLLATTCATSLAYVRGSHEPTDPEATRYPLTIFDDTLAAGSTTDSLVIRALLGGAFNKVRKLIARQEKQDQTFRQIARDELAAKEDLIVGPEEGEVAVMMQSDMHCNTTMIGLQTTVFSMLTELGEDVPAMLAITGDLTTNGTAAEGPCIRDIAAIAGDRPVVAVTGNHESDLSVEQMTEAGMTVLDGDIEEVGPLKVLGIGDPARSELFGGTELRGTKTQGDVGSELYGTAERADEAPDLLLVHEGYAAAAFMGIGAMGQFMQEGQPDLITPMEDDVRNLPASAVFYGHWHRELAPRVVWNDDGTWTLIMELDTSGGALDEPTLSNFSTPWSQPRRQASFPVVFFDEETGLARGYQIYRFATDGTVTIDPRVDVGVP